MPLTYKGIDIMDWTKDRLNNPKSQAAIDAHITAIDTDFPTLTHIGISVPFNTQAQADPDFVIDPAVYTERFTTPIHNAGLKVLWRPTHCTFEGIYSSNGFNKNNLQNSVFKSDLVTWADTNYALFATGDLVGAFPEAYAHQNLSDGGQYGQFFIDLGNEMAAALATHGKTVNCKMTAHNFTDALQNRNGQVWQIFNDSGITIVDHYGSALGLNKRADSFSGQANSGSATYTVPTTISEATTAKFSFIPEKSAYNKDIDVFIVNPGSGNWTMTIHDSNNLPVKLADHTNLSNLTTSATVTIPNASLTANAYNTFSIDWTSLVPDSTYHLHLTSTVADGTVKVHASHASDLAWLVCIGYRHNARPEAMEIDIRNLYTRTGHQVFLQEWGDYWSLNSGLSSPVRTQAQHEAYLDSMYAALQRLVNDNILIGFNYWRACGGFESIYDSSGTTLTYAGQRLQTFYANNAAAPTAPTAPTLLDATTVSSTAIDLTWTDNSANETGFKIERKTGVGGTYVQIATNQIDDTTYSDTGLTASTEYYYRVRAYNNTGNSSYATEDNATTSSTTAVATPTIAPNGGTILQPQTITLATTTSGATIRYTTDGTTPTAGSTLYSTPFVISISATVKAIGIKAGLSNSSVVSATFTLFNVAPTSTGRITRRRRKVLAMLT
jgi:hypothetical protein